MYADFMMLRRLAAKQYIIDSHLSGWAALPRAHQPALHHLLTLDRPFFFLQLWDFAWINEWFPLLVVKWCQAHKQGWASEGWERRNGLEYRIPTRCCVESHPPAPPLPSPHIYVPHTVCVPSVPLRQKTCSLLPTVSATRAKSKLVGLIRLRGVSREQH